MKSVIKQTMMGLALLLSLAACDSQTASMGTQNFAAIEWDMASNIDSAGYMPKNSNLIQMR